MQKDTGSLGKAHVAEISEDELLDIVSIDDEDGVVRYTLRDSNGKLYTEHADDVEVISETVIRIKYLSAKDNFQEREEVFKGYEFDDVWDRAVAWAKANLPNYHADMIKVDR